MAIQIRNLLTGNPWGLGKPIPLRSDWEWERSNVQGNGVIVKRFLPKGTRLGPTRVKDATGWKMLHPLGNYNHSMMMENAVIVKHTTVMEVILIKDLYPGDEMLVDFRKQPGFEQPLPGWKE